jgi:hypothetical protein
MARKKALQTSFSAGELAPEVAMRQDTDQYQNGAKSLLNRRMLIGGGHVRRPGSWWEATLGTDPVMPNSSSTRRRNTSSRSPRDRCTPMCATPRTAMLTAAGSITGGPWTGTIYKEMDWVQRGNVIFLTATGMKPQRIERTGAATWARTDFAYTAGPSLRPEQPYLKLAAQTITLRASGVTGSVTLTASAAYFVVGHVGSYIRYLGKAMLITGFTSSTIVTATVIEQLPKSQTLTVGSTAGFVGQQRGRGRDLQRQGHRRQRDRRHASGGRQYRGRPFAARRRPTSTRPDRAPGRHRHTGRRRHHRIRRGNPDRPHRHHGDLGGGRSRRPRP